jgi:hypothetical protein
LRLEASSGFDNHREAVGPVIAVAREAANAKAIPAHHQPLAVGSLRSSAALLHASLISRLICVTTASMLRRTCMNADYRFALHVPPCASQSFLAV